MQISRMFRDLKKKMKTDEEDLVSFGLVMQRIVRQLKYL